MSPLETRIAKMEQATAQNDLKKMTDSELMAYAGSFPMFSKGMYAALIALVGLRPSTLPVVKDDPEHAKP